MVGTKGDYSTTTQKGQLISFQYLKDTFDLTSQDFYGYLNIFIYRYV